MKTRTSCLLLGVCLLAGCWQKSLHPFYQPADVAFDASLIGSWRETKDSQPGQEDNGQIWTFTDGVNKGYKLDIEDDNEAHHFEAHLFKIDGQSLLDILTTERGANTIPAHNLFKVVATEPNLELAALNTDWVQKWLRQNPGALAHFAVADPEHPDDREKDELVLTADTKALQKFLRQHMSEDDFFGKPEAFKSHDASLKKN